MLRRGLAILTAAFVMLIIVAGVSTSSLRRSNSPRPVMEAASSCCDRGDPRGQLLATESGIRVRRLGAAAGSSEPRHVNLTDSGRAVIAPKTLKEFMASDEVIIVYRRGILRERVTAEEVNETSRGQGIMVLKRLKRLNMDVVRLPPRLHVRDLKTLREVVAYLKRAVPGIVNAYPVMKYRLHSVYFNDPLIQEQWYLQFTRALEAWDITTGSREVVVAVIDVGVPPHSDIVDNLWINSGEVPWNRVDDDGNGYVDDVYGYDFYDDDPYPWGLWSSSSHGAAVAGVIAATANNSVGIAGVSPSTSVMALRAGSYGWLYIDDILEAIDYVISMKSRGVDVATVVAAWGSVWAGIPTGLVIDWFEMPLYQAIEELYHEGILFVNSAGNEKLDLDSDLYTFTPGEYRLPNMLTVASVGVGGELSQFSNYGYKAVDVAAPGEQVLSLYAYLDTMYHYFDYEWYYGTSMAAPQVAAAAALVAGLYRSLGIEAGNPAVALKMALLFSAAESIVSETGGTVSVLGYVKAGYLDVANALNLVRAAGGELFALPVEPAPHFYGAERYLADIVPAGVEVPFKALIGTPTGPVSAAVQVVDEAYGSVVGGLHDDGAVPDEYAGDGVYSGYIRLPLNSSNAGAVEERGLTLVVDGRDCGTYTYLVFNVPATYSVEAASDFIWIEPRGVPLYSGYPTYGVALSYNIPLFGLSTYELAPLSSYAVWMAQSASQLVLGMEVNDLEQGIYPPTLLSVAVVEPINLPGVAGLIAAFTGGSPWSLSAESIQLFEASLYGQDALVVYYHLYEWYYGCDIYGEVIVLQNGTMIASYESARAIPGAIAFVQFNKPLYAACDLTSIADEGGKIVEKTIVFRLRIPYPTFRWEWGYVSADNNWERVQLANAYVNPVVVAGPPTYNGYQPAVVELADVTSTSFSVRVREWDYLDGSHHTERIGYLVVEQGVHTLPDGRVLQAGYAEASTDAWTWVQFPQQFNTTPVVIASVVGPTDYAVTVRIKDVSSRGFRVLLQPQQSLMEAAHVSARVAWAAVERGSSATLEAREVQTPAGDKPQLTINFTRTYHEAPVVLASINSFAGWDPASLRILAVDARSLTLMLEEEASYDSEMYHRGEQVAIVVLPRT